MNQLSNESPFCSVTIIITLHYRIIRLITVDSDVIDVVLDYTDSHIPSTGNHSFSGLTVLLVIGLLVLMWPYINELCEEIMFNEFKFERELLEEKSSPCDLRIEEKSHVDLGWEEKFPPLLSSGSEEKLSVELEAERSIPDVEGTSYFVCRPFDDGINGVYLVKDEKDDGFLGIFKPHDEEAFAPENPKGKVGEAGIPSLMKRGVIVGDAVRKEVAAYCLDNGHRAGVPFTFFADVPYNSDIKHGSLQRFVKSDGCCEDFSSSLFPVEQVHAIGLLDLRIFNLDRHSGNILVSVPEYNLYPIDHGYSIPDYRDFSDGYVEWLTWPQCRIPFSDETKEDVFNINIENDVSVLQQIGIRYSSIVSYALCTTFVKKAVSSGLTLYDIVSSMQRDIMNPDLLSQLEILRDQTLKVAPINETFDHTFSLYLKEFEIACDSYFGS